MKDYVKHSIRENNPDHVIIHVDTNELDSERQADVIAKSFIDVAKGIRANTCTASISGVVRRNDNLNNKALDVNGELAIICREAKLDFITHKNINPRADLNKSRLHLNRNGSDKIGKNFVDFILKYKWGHTENCVKSSDVLSTFTESQEVFGISETNDLNATNETNQDLRCLPIKNLKKLIIVQLYINSVQNKFDLLTYQIKDSIDILMITETKLDESPPTGQFFRNDFSSLFRLDRDRNGGGILLYIREDILSKLLAIENIIEAFFVDFVITCCIFCNYIRKNG